MNYIIEDNIDFYAELAKLDTITTNTDSAKVPSICLITTQPLSANAITLPCSHTFNYLPLYKDVCIQKKKNNIYEVDQLSLNQMRCPYCRTKFDKILPRVAMSGVDIVMGVNYPARYCMTHLKCSHLLTSGKHVGQPCGHTAYTTPSGAVCCVKHSKKEEASLHKNAAEVWTDEMTAYSKTCGIVDLQKILRENHLHVSGPKKELVMRIFNAGIH